MLQSHLGTLNWNLPDNLLTPQADTGWGGAPLLYDSGQTVIKDLIKPSTQKVPQDVVATPAMPPPQPVVVQQDNRLLWAVVAGVGALALFGLTGRGTSPAPAKRRKAPAKRRKSSSRRRAA